MSHLTDAQLQSVADGTLRGPEGLAAHAHCDACGECGAALLLYTALSGRLSSLQDPPPPLDFTAAVLTAVSVRESHLLQRRHTLLAALPALALSLFAIFGWAWSAGLAVHVDRLVEGATVARHVFGVLGPVLEAVRLPLALGAFGFLAVILLLLARTLRGAGGPRAAAS